jgi:hypothetical protein
VLLYVASATKNQPIAEGRKGHRVGLEAEYYVSLKRQFLHPPLKERGDRYAFFLLLRTRSVPVVDG